MRLQEIETKLAELETEITKLLEAREAALRDWYIAFQAEGQDNISCLDEDMGSCHKLYLTNGEAQMLVCQFASCDMKGSLRAFYKVLEASMRLQNIANGRDLDLPDYQKNLVYAKAAEIREKFEAENREAGGDVFHAS